MSSTPTVGRIVHYVARGSRDGIFAPVCRAAIVAEVTDDETVTLAVMNPNGVHFNPCAHDPGTPPPHGAPGATCNGGDLLYPGGTWHWPER